MEESKQKNAIYKNGKYTKILGFSRNDSNIKKVKTNYLSNIIKHMETVKSSVRNSSPYLIEKKKLIKENLKLMLK